MIKPTLRPEITVLAFPVLVIAAALFAACGGGGDGGGGQGVATATPDATPTAVATPSTGDLARSVVQIIALDFEGFPIWTGSGTVISTNGLILTNAHVVDDRTGEYDRLSVSVTERTDQPPEPLFIAEIAAVDYALDLAVIRIVADLDGNAVDPADADLRPIDVGDSDMVELGDRIRILGFPGIGGETVTFTEGSISGFTAQRAIADRAWIKTDATISGGNSGGLAANQDGEIIGVPTIVGSSEESSDLVDCRYVVDTNRDGTIDGQDSCVPVGGFINGLRPVALALPLIDAAQAGETYVSAYAQEPEPVDTFDVDLVLFDNFVFSDGVTTNDTPTNILPALPTGATEVCAFWDYTGMADGVGWEALWFVDGELDEAGSIVGETWFGGESGNWWVCNFDERALPEGFYELVISVDNETQIADGVYVGGVHPLVELDIEDFLPIPICFVFLSPSDAQNWGLDELGAEELIEPADFRTFFIPAGIYDLLLLDCDGETLAEEYELDITSDGVYSLE